MTSEIPKAPAPSPTEKRVIKRYSNRKLYDTRDSRYVTLLQIADMVRAGEDVQVVDNTSKEDKTDVTLALIISEELKERPRGIPLQTLKVLIRHRGEKLLSQLREGPIGRLMPQVGSEAEEAADSSVTTSPEPEPAGAPPEQEPADARETPKGLRATLEQWQHTVDERVRTVLSTFSPLSDLQSELAETRARLAEVEQELADLRRKHQE